MTSKTLVFSTSLLAALSLGGCEKSAPSAPADAADAGNAEAGGNVSLALEKACPGIVPTVLSARYHEIEASAQSCLWKACEGKEEICVKLRRRLRQAMIAQISLMRGAAGHRCLDVQLGELRKAKKADLEEKLGQTYACMKQHCLQDLDAAACRRASTVAATRNQPEDAKRFSERSSEILAELTKLGPEKAAEARGRELAEAQARAQASCDAGAKENCRLAKRLGAALRELQTKTGASQKKAAPKKSSPKK